MLQLTEVPTIPDPDLNGAPIQILLLAIVLFAAGWGLITIPRAIRWFTSGSRAIAVIWLIAVIGLLAWGASLAFSSQGASPLLTGLMDLLTGVAAMVSLGAGIIVGVRSRSYE